MSDQILLSVEDLVTAFHTDTGKIRAVDGVSFQVRKGKTLGIVGESGCGKSVTSLSVMRLIPSSNGEIERGRILFDGRNLLELSADQMRKLRGDRLAMIFQEPMTALNPVYTVGEQIAEVFRIHRGATKREAHQSAIEMLERVRISDAAKRVDEYPHQMSGGMKQRVMIAMALACNPALLIADEPTTALDVTIQAQVLHLMRELQDELGTSIMFITHDLGVIAEMADEVIVMYAGCVAERASVIDIFERPAHPYTKGLLRSIPKITDRKDEQLATIKGMVPSLRDLPPGCRFQNRCPYRQDICTRVEPRLAQVGENHEAACHFATEVMQS